MSNLLEKASLVYIPSGYKEDTAYSVIPTDGSGDMSFTRSSDGTRVNSQGLVERVPWNLLSNSQVFSLWNKVQIGSTVTVTDNFTTAPNGSLTAAKVVFSTFDGSAQIFQNYSLDTTQIYTSSLYAKVPSGTKQAYFGFYDGTSKVQLKTLTTEWQRIEYTGSINSGTVRACWFYGDGGASNVEVHLWGGQLNEGTLKPYFPTTDRLNVPRLDYSNGCPSLLLEPQRTNELTYSEQFDNAAWIKINVIVTTNNATSPDGYVNADKLIPTTTASGHQIKFAITGAAQTMSVFAKAGEYSTLALFYTVHDGRAVFDLSAGTITETTGTVTASIEDYGNGWYRCILSTTLTTQNEVRIYAINGTTWADFSNAGNGTSGIYLWGAQLEAGSYATSYIPTTSASVTRVADVAYKTGISSLIGQTEGTLFVEMSSPINTVVSNYFSVSDGTYNNRASILFSSGTNVLRSFLRVGGTPQADMSTNAYNITEMNKIAFAYSANDFVMYVNGTLINSDTSGSTFSGSTLNTISFSEIGTSAGALNGNINQAALFKTRLTNAELAAITSL